MKNESILFFLFLGFFVQAQERAVINKKEVIRIETELASDKMEGRATFSPGIELASKFIEAEFKKINLSYFDKTYLFLLLLELLYRLQNKKLLFLNRLHILDYF